MVLTTHHGREKRPSATININIITTGDVHGAACAFWPHVRVPMVCTSWYVVPMTHWGDWTGLVHIDIYI